MFEVEVPQLKLTSKVNFNGANGKGAVELDWSGYDVSDKYFVIYRKQKGDEQWKTIVTLDGKYNNNKYVDNLGNDKEKPTEPEINIVDDVANNLINISSKAIDNGSNYVYYIEAYDKDTQMLLSKSDN